MRRLLALVLLLLQASPAAALDLDSLFYRPLAPDAWSEAGPRLYLGKFIDSWNRRDLDAYASLLANDFVFHFGGDEDRSWGRDDELAAADHLFHGSGLRPAARAIALDPGVIRVLPDPEFPCDRVHHALIDLPQVTLAIEFEDGSTAMVHGHHAYWIVRVGEEWQIRRWDEEPAPGLLEPLPCAPVAVAGETQRLWTVAPNPSRLGGGVTLAFAVEQDGDEADVAIFNVAGRHVAVLARGPESAGPKSLVWDGRDAQGSSAPPGVYFLRVRVGGREWRERIIRM